MDAEQQEFFGHVPSLVFSDLHAYYAAHYGKGFLGRTMCRRIKAETQANLFVLSDYPDYESLLSVALEVQPCNVMILQLDKPLDLAPHQVYPIKDANFRLIQTEDKELMRMLIRGVTKTFVGIE